MIGVVTVAYASDDVLPGFLDSLAGAGVQELDVVVVDNGPNPVELGGRTGIRVVDPGGNVGYGRAANAGVAVTDTEWVVVTNPDIVWRPGALDELLRAAARHPRAGSLGPLIHTPTGAVYPSARELPSLYRGIGHALCGWWWPANPWTAAYRVERSEPVERPAGWLSGSCLLLRRAAFDQVGGFDPSYFMYFEDVDLGARLGAAGWQNVYVPSAEVDHAGGHATATNPSLMAAEHHRSAYRYLSRRYAGPAWLPVRLAIRAGLYARSLLARRVRAVAAGARAQRMPGGNS